MKKYEVTITIMDKSQLDPLIVGLVRQGYSVYYNEDEDVLCYNTTDDEVTEVSDKC